MQTIMRLLQVLVPQVEKMCIEKGVTDENDILKFLQVRSYAHYNLCRLDYAKYSALDIVIV